jgi:hypothetical protein
MAVSALGRPWEHPIFFLKNQENPRKKPFFIKNKKE